VDMVQEKNSTRSRIRVVDYRQCDIVSSFGFGAISAWCDFAWCISFY